MKKVYDIIKPFISIIFGALLFLIYLNSLDSQNGYFLALGILGVIFACYYIATGIIGLIVGSKLPARFKMVLEILSVDIFTLFMFLRFLFVLINYYDLYGPTAWTISIISMIASLAISGFYVVARLVNKNVLYRIASMFASIFVLALLLDLVFDLRGNSVGLGEISVINLVLYALFAAILLSSVMPMQQQEQPAPQQAAEPEPEPEAEPEEAKEEEPAPEEEKEEKAE
ncbi:MAG: hypothetical protein K5925_05050 [Bacilli bacterium]|nr:hypothetical protein [Bacilli bacterium]